jgi:hypothetical protein
MHKSASTPAALIGLIFVWSAGAALGIWIANGNVSTLAAALRLSGDSVRFPFALSVSLPLLSVYLVTRSRLPGLIFPILFLKSMADSVLLMGICVAYGSAAWLAAALLLFTDKLATVLLIYFAGKCLTEGAQPQGARFVSLLIAVAAIAAIDFFYISPYFAQLIL